MYWVTPNAPEIYGEIRQGYKDTAAEAGRLGKNVSKGMEKLQDVGKKVSETFDRTADKIGGGIRKGAKQLEGAGKKAGDALGKAGRDVGWRM